MITARERIKPTELLTGILNNKKNKKKYLNTFLPLKERNFIFTNMGKAAFEQVVISANLQNSKILLPAFIPDDFVGIFQKYNITPQFIDVHPDSYHLNLELIEQPLSVQDTADLQFLENEILAKIAFDESLINIDDAKTLLEQEKKCGIFNIKLMKCAGIYQAKQIADLAQRSDVQLMWGCNDESIISIR